MKKKYLSMLLVFTMMFGLVLFTVPTKVSAASTNYYVDSVNGSDSNNGTSTSTPWKTLSKVSSTTFQPGDIICLACGDTFTSGFTPNCSGTSTSPITLTSYGSGPRPKIQLDGSVGSWCVTIVNVSYWNISNIEMCNAEDGIVFNSTNTGCTYYHVSNCYFHDLVMASPDWDWSHVGRPKWGAGICMTIGSQTVDGLQVTNCFTQNSDSFMEGYWSNCLVNNCTSQFCSMNTLENLQSGTVENCVFSHNGGQRSCPIGGTDIMEGVCNGVTIKNSDFGWRSRYSGNPDGCCFDYEWGCINTTVQNNFFHDAAASGVFIYRNPGGTYEHQNILVDSNLFYDDSNNYPDHTDWGEIAAAGGNPTGAVSNNTYYLLSGIAFLPNGIQSGITLSNNNAGTKTFVAMPTMSIDGGAFGSGQSVTLSDTTSGATIYYTTDGSVPTTSSTQYTGTAISISQSSCLNAKAFKSGMENSTTNTQIYSINPNQSSIIKAWEFSSDTQGWTAGNQVSGLGWVSGGYLNGTITGSDPYIYSASGLNTSISNYKYVKVCLKNSTSSTTGQIYFITTVDGTWNDAKNMNFTINANDPNYTEYTIDMSNVSGWSGTLAQFRLDPNSGVSSGSFSVDYIRIQNSSGSSGDTQAPTVPTNLASTGTTTTTVSLSWTASTDNVGVTGYNIYRGGTKVGTSATTSYTDTGLTANTQYSYTVSAYDAANNTSSQSSSINATTANNSNVIANAGFETPSVSSYQYGAMTYSWTFGTGAGVEHNGGTFGAANAPEGVQAAFVQGSSSATLTQTVSFSAGTYQIDFQAAKRTSLGGTQTFTVYFDSTLVGTFTPSSGSFSPFNTNSFTATAGNHTIQFVGTVTGDNTDFIDAVSISVPTATNWALGKTVTASSTHAGDGWNLADLVDGNTSPISGYSGWSSESNTTVNHTEWVTVDMGANHSITTVDLFAANPVCFPIDFTIAVSTDNTNWTTVVTRTGYAQPSVGVAQVFTFSSQNVRYVRVQGTNLRQNPAESNWYRMQLAEDQIFS